MIVFDRILKLYKQLFPTGRAWWMPVRGLFEGLTIGLSSSGERFYNDSTSLLDSLLPDNDNFTADDATDWERRLGMITNENVDLVDRKLAIMRKMQFPGQARARMAALYIQGQLQAAGFNVWVHENLTNYPPSSVAGASILSDIEYGEVNYGEMDFGSYYNNKLVNHIDEGKDDFFDEGGSFRASMIIGGQVLGTWADVSVDRKDEFRQLVLKKKPTQFVIYLLVNYNY